MTDSTPTGCQVTWTPVSAIALDPREKGLGYHLHYKVSIDSNVRTKTVHGQNSVSTTLDELEEFESYEITVTAFNRYGEGMTSFDTTCKTKEDGELYNREDPSLFRSVLSFNSQQGCMCLYLSNCN